MPVLVVTHSTASPAPGITLLSHALRLSHPHGFLCGLAIITDPDETRIAVRVNRPAARSIANCRALLLDMDDWPSAWYERQRDAAEA